MSQLALFQHEFTKKFLRSYMTKKDLYNCLRDLRNDLRIEYESPLCSFASIIGDYITVEARKFKNNKLCGIINKAMAPDISYVVINSNNPREIRVFSLLHELMHWFFHSPRQRYCNVMGGGTYTFEDYQANEGAAELLMHYRHFILLVSPTVAKKNLCLNDIVELRKYAAELFGVTEGMVYYRLESLKYEIYQYINGVDIDALELLSKKQQLARGIKVSSLNDTEKILRNSLVKYA